MTATIGTRITAAPGNVIRAVGSVYRPPRFRCASRWAAVSVPHRSSGSAQSDTWIMRGPYQIVTAIPTAVSTTAASSGKIRLISHGAGRPRGPTAWADGAAAHRAARASPARALSPSLRSVVMPRPPHVCPPGQPNHNLAANSGHSAQAPSRPDWEWRVWGAAGRAGNGGSGVPPGRAGEWRVRGAARRAGNGGSGCCPQRPGRSGRRFRPRVGASRRLSGRGSASRRTPGIPPATRPAGGTGSARRSARRPRSRRRPRTRSRGGTCWTRTRSPRSHRPR